MSEILANSEQYPRENRCLPHTQDQQSYIKPNFLKGEILDRYLTYKAEYFAGMKLLRWYNGEWFMLNNMIYQPLNEDFFNNFAYKNAMLDNIILKPRHCKELLDTIKIRICETFTEPDDESFTVFKNGLISNFNGMPLSVISFDYFATICVDANYLSAAKLDHPHADAFLNTISGGDPELITRHWEFWGYVLSSDYHAKAIFSLFGKSGNNGKSTELDMLKMFLPRAVDSMPIKTLTSTYGMQRIRHCRLEYSADEGAVNLGSESIGFLKSASGFDDITANVKFKEMVHFKCKCKIAIASNYNIGMAYTAVDTAFGNRIVTIPYPYSIPKEHQDPMILQKLLTEKDAIATEAFRYYLRLKGNNYIFTGSERFDQIETIMNSPINAEYAAINDFSQKFCDFSDSNIFTSTQDLYAVFAANYETNIKDSTGFSQAFGLVNKDKIQNKRQRIHSHNLRGFKGVKLISP